MTPPERQLSRYGWRPADPPRRPVLFINPRSGDGKAARAGLAERARDTGIETVILGPVDFSASLGMPSLSGGLHIPEYPGDYFHYVFMRILMAGRANGLQVIDGPGRDHLHAVGDLERHALDPHQQRAVVAGSAGAGNDELLAFLALQFLGDEM